MTKLNAYTHMQLSVQQAQLLQTKAPVMQQAQFLSQNLAPLRNFQDYV